MDRRGRIDDARVKPRRDGSGEYLSVTGTWTEGKRGRFWLALDADRELRVGEEATIHYAESRRRYGKDSLRGADVFQPNPLDRVEQDLGNAAELFDLFQHARANSATREPSILLDTTLSLRGHGNRQRPHVLRVFGPVEGELDEAGRFRGLATADSDTVDGALNRLAAVVRDPRGHLSALAKVTARCPFCGHEVSNGAEGWGYVCARVWGLPYDGREGALEAH